MNWHQILGRVSFVNCDPLYYSLPEEWGILPAPPAWLTGHLMRKDCLLAPIPTADFARNSKHLKLLPGLGIGSVGAVGSVLLFGNRDPSMMRDIALPTDSATSRMLMMWILNQMGLNPRPVDMGPNLDEMLSRCDGALLIGDRAIDESIRNPELVRLDLGQCWFEQTGLPMVFGVFAAHVDAPESKLKEAHECLLDQLNMFENCQDYRLELIEATSHRSGFSVQRVEQYFDEVVLTLDVDAQMGLKKFLNDVCGVGDYEVLQFR